MSHQILTRYGKVLLSKWLHLGLIVALCLFLFYDQKPLSDSQAINKAIEHLFSQENEHIKSALSDQYDELKRFYTAREFSPVWHEDETLNAEARFIMDIMASAKKEGLSGTDYPLHHIKKNALKTVKQAKNEIYLTAYLARFLVHLRNGRIDEATADQLWPKHPDFIAPYDWIQQNSRSNRIVAKLFEQTPPHQQYERLRDTLEKLRKIEKKGGWPTLPLVSLLKPGLRDSRVKILKRRLIISGDLERDALEDDLYDDRLRNAVTRFQRRHGILSDGLAGIETLQAMNVPVSERIKQIEINMERWRLMQRDLGNRYILVNSAGFELIAVDDKTVDLQMRVIVGETDLATPVFSAPITKITLNPEWHVPRSISTKELLIKVQTDANYLSDNDFVIFRMDANKRRTYFDPLEIDWSELSEEYFPYEVVQLAGNMNPLGRVKFFIPNFHSIYLHDTSQRHLFDHTFRNLSHGCIRLEKPKDLMRYLLKYDSIWGSESINSAWDSDNTRTIELKNRVPVHIFYFTTWIDDDGTVNFYPDVYSYDKRIESLLM
jgi:murein L,D-transpeptidase YcbB/YkuD